MNAIDPSKLTMYVRHHAPFPLTITKKSNNAALVLIICANQEVAFMINFETSMTSPAIQSLCNDSGSLINKLSASVDGTTLTLTSSSESSRLWGASLIIVAENI